ncbi:MAG: PEGA domain-containing protein, partial [Planctomycetaceae bacterium]|nr:PEGA domain-containing protein [Planctomycetaceae bacterium]
MKLQIANCKLQIANGWLSPSGFRLFLVVTVLVASLPGCVHRRLTVNSNPPGARVLLDGEEVGETPTSVDFTHYGTHEVVLQKDGYDTLKTMQTVPAPWYQVPPIDFFSDNLLPFQLTNRH